MTKFVSDLRQVDSILRVLRFPPPLYNWNIVESGIKHHKPTKPTLFLSVLRSISHYSFSYFVEAVVQIHKFLQAMCHIVIEVLVGNLIKCFIVIGTMEGLNRMVTTVVPSINQKIYLVRYTNNILLLFFSWANCFPIVFSGEV
jgi:hypothetical protein